MLFDFIESIKRHNIDIQGILHIGAHDGGELPNYQFHKVPKVIFVEANPAIYNRLLERCKAISDISITAFNIGIANKNFNKVPFHISNNDSASSSILEFGDHRTEYPDIVFSDHINIETITIDRLFEKNNLQYNDYNILNMDIQGAEMLALRGASRYLQKCDAVYLEVNFREMYKDCGKLQDIDSLLNSFKFERMKLIDTGRGWGDALYIKKSNTYSEIKS